MLLENLRKPRLILFLALFLLTVVLFWQARAALTPFAIGLIIAYLILPLVNRLDHALPDRLRHRNLSRPLAILIVYGMGIVFVIWVISLLLPLIVDQVVALYRSAPGLTAQAILLFNQALAEYEALDLPADVRLQIEQAIRDFNLPGLLQPVVRTSQRALGAIGSTLSFMLGLIVIPFWLFFILTDEATVIRGAMRLIPHDIRPDVEAVRIIVDGVLSRYIRGQLLVAGALGVAITIGLLILDVQFALLLGLAAGALALFPFIGAILGAIPAIIAALLQDPILALYVLGLFVLVQQIDNLFFSPKIVGDAVALHPALIMVVIVVGSSTLGLFGALVAVPLTAILRDVGHYLYIRVGDEVVSPIDALTRIGYGNQVTRMMQEAGNPRLAAPRAS